jgi:hypothetical protein
MLILLWICPILLLYFSNQPLVKSLETLRKRRFALVCALAIGALSQMMLYSMNVYPNVVASAGGGQPQVARIYLKSISGLQPITEPHQILETNSEVTTQYDVVILHKDERNTYFLFVKDFTNKKSKYAVFSVRNEFIEATLNLNAAVIFYPFKKERVVIFLDDDAPQK